MVGGQARGQRGAAVGGQRRLGQLAGEAPDALDQAGGDQLVAEVLQRLDEEVQRAGEQDHPVAAALVLADAADRLVLDPRLDEVRQRLLGLRAQLARRQVLVEAVEVAVEGGARAPVLHDPAGHAGGDAGRPHRACRTPACRACAARRRSARRCCRARRPRRRRSPAPGGPSGAGRRPALRSLLRAGRGRHGDRAQRRQVDLAEVVVPVDLVDVEAEALAVVGVQLVEQLARVAVVEDAVQRAVGPVDLVQAPQPVDLALVLVQAQLDPVAAAGSAGGR